MLAGRMVGRDAELAALVRAWSAVAGAAAGGVGAAAGGVDGAGTGAAGGGAGRAVAAAAAARPVVVTGAAGIGKSLLVAAALERLHPAPRCVLSGTARVHTPAPYDWLAAVLSGRDVGRLPAPPDALAWLAQHPDQPRERYAPDALLRLAVRIVRALVGTGPAVLVVEDLHALDPASLNLVGELAVAPDLPALLLVTSQPPDAAVSPEYVARTLARLTGTPGAVRQHLKPLRAADVAQLVARARPAGGSPIEADALWQRSGGNPHALYELLAVGGAAPATVTSALSDLTAREVEVLSCLAAGMSNKQVARSLGISVRTVAVHVSNLLRKTRSASRTEAALWAVQHQLTR